MTGTPVVYAAGSRALAALEMLVHLKASDLADVYALVEVAIPESLIERPPPEALPSSWAADPIPIAVQQYGTDWADSHRSCVLRVPSAVIPDEHNYLLNPRHARFADIILGQTVPFTFDPRLLGK